MDHLVPTHSPQALLTATHFYLVHTSHQEPRDAQDGVRVWAEMKSRIWKWWLPGLCHQQTPPPDLPAGHEITDAGYDALWVRPAHGHQLHAGHHREMVEIIFLVGVLMATSSEVPTRMTAMPMLGGLFWERARWPDTARTAAPNPELGGNSTPLWASSSTRRTPWKHTHNRG